MESNTRYTLGKQDRLKRKKYIDELFKSGKGFSVYPLRVLYLIRHDSDIDDGTPGWSKRIQEPILQFGVGVSKKNFKKAVDRNRIKRLIREAYRLGNAELAVVLKSKKEFCLKLFISYIGKELPDFILIQEKMNDLMNRLVKKCDW